MATLLLLGVALTAAGWIGTSAALLDAGLVVTAGGVLYGVLQLVRGGA
jgi:hypothetical protein